MKRKQNSSIFTYLIGGIVPLCILLIWYLFTRFSDVPRALLPSPEEVVYAFGREVKSGTLMTSLTVSVIRVVKGFLIAAFFGVVLGVMTGRSLTLRRLLGPTLTAIRQIPMIAWIPLFILWFGIGEMSKVAVIVLAAFFQVYVNTERGVENVPREYNEVAEVFQLSGMQKLFRVIIPCALPSIFTGLKLGLGVSWMAVVAAEMIAATSGIGYRLTNARSMMQGDVVICCMILIAVIGIIMDKVLSAVFGRLLFWND